MPEVLALIPARGGSKGVPGKNVRIVAGKPLLAHSIQQALAARRIDRVVVSSDDPEILEIAAKFGAEALPRPAALATDEAPVIGAIRHAVDALGPVEAVALLQPTAPLRTPDDIDAAVTAYLTHGRAVCSVFRVDDAHPARMYRIEDAAPGRLAPLMADWAEARRQDLPPVYLRNGALYVFGPPEIASGRIITGDLIPYVMPADRSVNVDSERDLQLLRLVMEENGADPVE